MGIDIDDVGCIYLTHRSCSGDYYCNPATFVTKFSNSGNLLWSKSYGESDDFRPPIPRLSLLSNNKMALAWTRDTLAPRIPSNPVIIYLLDSVGNKEDSLSFGDEFITLHELYSTNDGSVIACGYRESLEGANGWVAKIDSNAQLLWERNIYDRRHYPNSEIDGFFIKVMEDDQGAILCTGYMTYRNESNNGVDIWVVKLDKDGCYDSTCDSNIINIISSVQNQPEQPSSSLSLFPNPAFDKIYLRNIENFRLSKYSITSVNGTIVSNGILNRKYIDVDSLIPGVYFLTLYSNNRSYTQKILIAP